MAIFQPVVLPDPNKILIVDCSFYQGKIDFQKMKSEGVSGVILRAGQNLWVDPKLKENKILVKEAGLPFGSYWYFDSRVSPSEQSNIWVKAMDNDFGTLGMFLDLEERYNGSYKGWKNWYDFFEYLKLLLPKNVLIGLYTGYYYFKENAPSPIFQKNQLEYFHQYPLWIATYGNAPMIPKPYSSNEWLFWQFTDKMDGKLFGANSFELDGNYFNGDLKQWEDFSGSTTTQPPIPPTQKTYPTINNIDITLDNGEKRLFVKR